MKRNRKKRRMSGILLLVLAIGTLLSLSGITIASYIMQNSQSEIVGTENFYFTSNFLKEESENAVYYIDNPDSGDFTVKLFNYADKLRVTDTEITYAVSVVGGSVQETNGSIASGSDKQEASILITPGEGSSEIKVTVVSVKPYQKKLTATFIRKIGNTYSVEDKNGNSAAVLTMTCTDSEKDVTINLPDNVIPDQANDKVKKNADGTYTYRCSKPGAYSIVLLKTDRDMNLSVTDTQFTDTITVS